jgi:hypothetical protein
VTADGAGAHLASVASDLASRLCLAARDAGWSGPDPYDALWWEGWPRALTRHRRGRQLLIQLHARAPVDVRTLYRRRHPVISKTLAVFGAAAVRLHEREGDERHVRLAGDALGRLAADTATGTAGWGYPFPVQTRWSFYAAHAPNAIATAFGARALHEGAVALGQTAWAERARAAAEWALEALWADEDGWFVYHPSSRALIHNANLLVARLAWTVLRREGAVRERVARAVEHTLTAQRPDGTFPYGDGPGLEWADSFHTAYVLEALVDLTDIDPEVAPALQRGSDAYRERFFGPSGEAYLMPDRAYPQDGHSAGTALTTLSRLAARGVVEAAQAEPIARHTALRVVRGAHAVHRRYRLGSTRVAYIRWCDAHVALGLASYALAAPSGG